MTSIAQIKQHVKRRLPAAFFRSQRVRRPGNLDSPEQVAECGSGNARIPLVKDEVRGKFRFFNYDESMIESAFEALQVFEGWPSFTVLHDVWYFPELPGLYGADGVRIDEACIRRGPVREVWPPNPKSVAIPTRADSVAGPLIYVGFPFFKHYGHFLIESIARLWYAGVDLDTPLLCHDNHVRNPLRKTFVDEFLGASPIDQKRFVSFVKPVLLRQVVLPGPTLRARGEGFTGHRSLTQQVGLNLVPDATATSSRPIYLSRSRLGADLRLVQNEQIFESELENRGFEIVYPEAHSLQEQIELINRHEVIVGPMGSALHGILFGRSDRSTIVYIGDREGLFTEQHTNHTYLTIDAISPSSAVYIGALEPDSGSEKTLAQRDVVLNLEVALEGLRSVGIC